MKKVRIINYFIGNTFSVHQSFSHFGCDVRLIDRPEDISEADYLVLPGVGSFGEGIAQLEKHGLDDGIKSFANGGKPLLGICLGMQLLMTTSAEFGIHQGLNLVPGEVKRLPLLPGVKVPNIGWRNLDPLPETDLARWQNSPLSSVEKSQDFYFVHSFAAYPDSSEHWLSRTEHGTNWFCSTLWKGNIVGCQYHPEKSGKAGLKIIENFLKL